MNPEQIHQLPLSAIERDPAQPRRTFDATELADLAHDIEASHVKQPIEVYQLEENRYRLKTGERRWRASKLARKTTIPAIIVDHTGDDLAELADQCKENALRKDLSPIEWAHVFARLRDEGGIATHQIPTWLSEHGLRTFSRPAVSNYLAMLDLPEWVTDRINDGRLSAAHAKFLCRAKGADEVFDYLREDVEMAEEEERHYTTRDAEDGVQWGFQEKTQRLDGAPFDLAGCKKCRFRRLIKNSGRDYQYCLSEPCYQGKVKQQEQARADELAADRAAREQAERQGEESTGGDNEERPAQPKTAAAGAKPAEPAQVRTVAGLGFATDYMPIDRMSIDTAECQGCASNKQTEEYGPTCFDTECYQRKHRAAGREVGRLGRVSALLDAWLREQCKARMGELSRQQVLLWVALGGPECKRISYGGHNYLFSNYRTPKEIDGVAKAMNWSSLAHLLNDPRSSEEQDSHDEDPVALAVDAIIDEMSRRPLRELAHFLSVDLSTYRVDEAYLKTLGTEGLTELLRLVVGDEADNMAGQSKTQRALRDLILADYVDAIGLPQELRDDWNKSQEPEAIDLPDISHMAEHLVDQAQEMIAAGDDRNLTTLLDIHTEAEERHWGAPVEYWESVDAAVRERIADVSQETE